MTDGKKPARYACHRNGVMVESESGEYVEYASLIAAQKERDDWKARAIGIDITLEGSNERFRKAEQALALRGEPVAGIVVPYEPTEEMIKAGGESKWIPTKPDPIYNYEVREVYQAMLEAAPLYAAPISGERATSHERIKEAVYRARLVPRGEIIPLEILAIADTWFKAFESTAVSGERVREAELTELLKLLSEQPCNSVRLGGICLTCWANRLLPLAAIQGEQE